MLVSPPKQIRPFLVANRLLDRNASRTRALNCGTIFPLKSNHPKRMKYSKNVSAAASTVMLILSRLVWLAIFLICLWRSFVNKIV